MEEKKKSSFWRLALPVLLYCLIMFFGEILVSAAISVYVVFFKLQKGDLVLREGMTRENLQEESVKFIEAAQKIYQEYQLELLAVFALLTMILTLILFFRDRKLELSGFRPVWKRAPLKSYPKIILLGTSVCMGFNCLSMMTVLVYFRDEYQNGTQSLYEAGFPVQVLCLGFLIPLAEELMFRGVFFRRCRENFGFRRSAVLSAAAFALFHSTSLQLLYTFALGMLLAYVYEKYGSLKAPVLLHATANLVSVAATKWKLFDWMLGSLGRMPVILVVSTFAGTLAFVLIRRMEGQQ